MRSREVTLTSPCPSPPLTLLLFFPETGHKTLMSDVPTHAWREGAPLSLKTQGHKEESNKETLRRILTYRPGCFPSVRHYLILFSLSYSSKTVSTLHQTQHKLFSSHCLFGASFPYEGFHVMQNLLLNKSV